MIGIDTEDRPAYPGHFVRCDVRQVSGHWFRGRVQLVVASPPCEQFTRHGLPWLRKRNPPPPDMTIAMACYRIAHEARCPLVMENVRFARPWFGPYVWQAAGRCLWGDGVPDAKPTLAPGKKKESYSSARRLERAMIPLDLARSIARYHQ